jgi:hypothetical protein
MFFVRRRRHTGLLIGEPIASAVSRCFQNSSIGYKYMIYAYSAHFYPKGGSRSKVRHPLPTSRLGSSLSCCAPAVTYPKVRISGTPCCPCGRMWAHAFITYADFKNYRTLLYDPMAAWCPFWSPVTPHSSIRGWVFYYASIPGVC